NYIGTEHILLGLIREGEGVAAQVLVQLGADLNRVRQQVVQLLHGYQGKEPAADGPRRGKRARARLMGEAWGGLMRWTGGWRQSSAGWAWGLTWPMLTSRSRRCGGRRKPRSIPRTLRPLPRCATKRKNCSPRVPAGRRSGRRRPATARPWPLNSSG